MMEVLLIKDVERLGKRGTHVTVKTGYARNHLLPLGYAVLANSENRRRIEKDRVKWLAEEAKLLEELRELAGHLAKLDLLVVEKASETGHLYGSVSEKTIAEAIRDAGINLDPKVIRLEHHLKEVGDYEVPVQLHEEVQVTVPVRVRAEGREDWLPGQDEGGDETPEEKTGEEAGGKPPDAAGE